MKRIITFLVSTLLATGLFAQLDEYRTIFDSGDFRISGFGGPCMSFTSFNGDFAHMMGGGGGIMLGDFFFGGYGMGTTNNLKIDMDDIEFGHGGLWFGYSFLSEKAVHPAVHLQTGWGSIDEDFDIANSNNYIYKEDKVFVLVPTVEMELNFTRFFRVSVGGNYMVIFGADESIFGLTDADLDSPGAYLAFKFGWF